MYPASGDTPILVDPQEANFCRDIAVVGVSRSTEREDRWRSDSVSELVIGRVGLDTSGCASPPPVSERFVKSLAVG